MKIRSFAIFTFLLFGFAVLAQQTSIIAVSIKGHVDYLKEPASDKKRLLPGMKIVATGAVNLMTDSKAKLLYNGKLIQLESPGSYDLKTLIEKKDKALSMSFAGRFWDFVNDGLSNSDDKKSINEYSERVLAITGGVQGFALGEAGIRAIMPAAGNIGAEVVTFTWNPLELSLEYQFKIYSPNDEEYIYETATKDTSITVNFNKISLYPGKPYEWSVEAEEEESGRVPSDLIPFEYFSDLDEIIAREAENISDYAEADTLDRQWMEAIIMEQENFIYDAFNRYLELRSQHPENLLVKKLYAAFLARQGFTQEAVDQMN